MDGNYLGKYIFNTEKHNVIVRDGLTKLKPEDDAVYKLTNGKCQIPDKSQFEELMKNTTQEWTKRGRVNGCLFTSKKNGKSIFIPAAGAYELDDNIGWKAAGYLWTNSLDHKTDSWSATCFVCWEGKSEIDSLIRCDGASLRGVSK